MKSFKIVIIRLNFILQNYFVLAIVLRQPDLLSKKNKIKFKIDQIAMRGDLDD